MKNDIFKTVKTILEVIAVVLMIFLTIGFFNTPFEKGQAQVVTNETIKERTYVEKMLTEIEKFTQVSTEIKETNTLSNEGKIVPMKMAQIYSDDMSKITSSYNQLSTIDVPERFKQFHVSFLKTMEYQGSAINEVLVYIQDKDTTHFKNVDKFNELFVQKYNDSINLFNSLIKEQKIK